MFIVEMIIFMIFLLLLVALSLIHIFVLNYLGYSWVDQNMNLDEGFNMLRRAVELRPTDGYIVDSLGLSLIHI